MTKIRGFEVLEEFKDEAIKIAGSIKDFLPQRATEFSAGYDLRSIEDVVINPNEIKLVGTGLTAYMLKTEELQIRARSGFAKNKIIIANSPGTIDSDYYGLHIKIMIFNLSNEPLHITAGDRISQGIFSKYYIADFDKIKDKARSGGFGSTGVK